MANNHALDFNNNISTIAKKLDVDVGGVGTFNQAFMPNHYKVHGTIITIHSVADLSSGVPESWAATNTKPGVALIDVNKQTQVTKYINNIRKYKDTDVLIVSVHIGPNWSATLGVNEQIFYRRLIDEAGVKLIHSHSRHHMGPIIKYNNALVIVAGDVINDYEGIAIRDNREQYLPQYNLAYFVNINDTDVSLKIVPLYMNNLRLTRVTNINSILKILNRLNMISNINFVADDNIIKSTN